MPPLHSLLRSAPTRRTLSPSAAVSAVADASSGVAQKAVRDRGLDHAVEREKNLFPLINTKNLLNAEPSKTLPISAIAELRASLGLPCRPVDFLRRYPSVFREFLPGGLGGLVRPHFGLTDEAVELHAEENLMYASETYRRDVAARVLRLLMLCRANKLPIAAVERLRWDLGLPQDFEQSLIPDFPDYFRVAESPGEPRALELVCWIGEFGKSVLEKKAKGEAIRFPELYSRGFEMEKKYKKWVEDWQKLPYFSPYEDSGHLPPKSEESDKWATAVLHEFLHILIPKKTEKENALFLGECLGLRAGIKRAMFQLPGIFYLSSKNYTYTLVLKEGYKRGVLVEDHPLMSMRSKYIHLMNSAREETKTVVSVPAGSGNAEKKKQESSEAKEEEGEEEHEGEFSESSEDEEEGEDESRPGGERDGSNGGRRRTRRGASLEVNGRARNGGRGRSAGKHPRKSRERAPRKLKLGTEKQDRRLIQRSSVPYSKGNSVPDKARL